MVDLDKMPSKRLERTIRERETFYIGIVDLVEKASQCVKPTKVEEQSCYTNIDRELKGFYGFDIEHHRGWSDRITITKDGQTVLSLSYQGRESPPRVSFASENRSWERGMKRLLKNPEESVNTYKCRMAKSQEAERDKQWKKQEEAEKRRDLMEKAKRMNLTS